MRKNQLFIYFFLISACLSSCENDNSDKASYSGETLFSALKSNTTGIIFSNDIKEDVNFHHLNWESIYNGGGVAIADFDNDGLDDIYFTGNQVDDAIYRNLGNLKFEDKTKSAGIKVKEGWSSGVSVADVNQDGFLDIYVCRMWHSADNVDKEFRKNLLLINQKDFTFKDMAESYGLADSGHSTQASFFDYDGDGDLDMYLMNAPSNNYNQKLEYINANKVPYEHADKLFRNNGEKYEDVSAQAGITDYGFGLGLLTVDLNNDGWTDIYVANDFEIADRMFINQKNGTFQDQIQSKLKHISFSSMGADAADINNDSYIDIAVLDMQSSDHYRSKTNMPSMDIQRFWTNVSRGQHYQFMSNMLQINNGYGFYSEVAQLAGMASTDWSWSVLMADFDNDQWKDIFITNGLNKDIRNNDFAEEMKKFRAKGPKSLFEFSQKVGSKKIENLAFKNNQGDFSFSKIAHEWGLDYAGFSYGAAYSDLDNDGDLDLVVNNNNEKASIYQNNASAKSANNWIQLLVSKNNIPIENMKCIIYAEGQKFASEQSRIRGFQSSVSPIMHFGLGSIKQIDSVVIISPFGRKSLLSNLAINKRTNIDISELNFDKTYNLTLPNYTDLTEISSVKPINFQHNENQYNDFSAETLLPHMQSKNGPYISSAKESKSDASLIYIGNSHGQSGKLFRYTGNFQEIKGPWSEDANAEDAGSALFDFDQDGDLDLYVASGGTEKAEGDPLYQDRLYLNNGNSWAKSNAVPDIKFNSSVVISADYDGDGDQDLFVGGGSIAQKYPNPSGSQLLVNEGGKLINKAETSAPGLSRIGIVQDAIWTDFNDDTLLDLIVVGEFMQPSFFENNGRQLIDKTAEYLPENLGGWWFSIEAADLDGDGVNEFILGNIGENNKYHPNQAHPLQIYGNDFDKNSTNDVVLTKTTDEYGEVPVRGRQCSSEQMPFIKSKFKDFDGYAKAKILDIYGEKGLEEAIHLSATEFSSGYLKKENGIYKFTPFPNQAQISAIRDIQVIDVNGDEKKDIICIGNLFDAEVETTRHDASIGMVLIQENNLTFHVKTALETGLYTPGNARKMTKIQNGAETLFLVTNNNFITQVIKQNTQSN